MRRMLNGHATPVIRRFMLKVSVLVVECARSFRRWRIFRAARLLPSVRHGLDGLQDMQNMLVRHTDTPDMSTLHAHKRTRSSRDRSLALHSALVVHERKEMPPQRSWRTRPHARCAVRLMRDARRSYVSGQPGGVRVLNRRGWRRRSCSVAANVWYSTWAITSQQTNNGRTAMQIVEYKFKKKIGAHMRELHAAGARPSSIFSYIVL